MLDWIQLAAIVGAGCAVLMTILWRRDSAKLRAREIQNDELCSTMSGLKAELQKERSARSRQSEELGEFRKRADKAKRRGVKNTPQPMGTASRIQDLEEASEKTALERDRLRGQRDQLNEEVAQLRTRIAAADRVAAAKEQAPAPTPAPASARAESPESPSVEERLAAASERVAELEGEGRVARETQTRLRKRMDTQEQLYASLRSELEVKKDRLRTQEEQLQRLQALKVAMLD